MSSVRLGLRLTVSGGREGVARLVMIAGAVALGVGLLLVTLAGFNAVNAQNARYAWLNSGAAAAHTPKSSQPLLWLLSADFFDGQTIGRIDVAATGPHSPVPPGIAHLPGPGQFYVSPALAALLRDTPANQLADRFGGREIGEIGDAALPAPNSLMIIIGHAAAGLARTPGIERVARIWTKPPNNCYSGAQCWLGVGIDASGIDLIFSVVALGMLFPVLIFISTATRLAAAAREQRFAAMRLVGATPGQVSVVSAVESIIAAIAGTAAGFGLFFVLRPPLAAIPWTGAPFFTSDLSLSLANVVLVGAGVPIASAAAALLALRRVRISPLGVTRRVTPRPPSAWRLIPLLAGVAELATVPFHVTLANHTSRQIEAFIPGFLLIMAGLIVAGPWLTMAGSRLLARRARRPSTLIAARRLADNPQAGFRAISGLILAMFVTSVAVSVITSIGFDQGFVGSAAASDTVTDQFTYGPSRVHVGSDLIRRVRALSGVSGVTVVRVGPAWVQVKPSPRPVKRSRTRPSGGRGNRPGQMLMLGAPGSLNLVTCSQLATTPALGRCAPGAKVAAVSVGGLAGPRADQQSVTWPAIIPNIQPTRLGEFPADAIFVATNGSSAAIERVRTVLDEAFPYYGPSQTIPDFFYNGSDVTAWQQLANVMVLVSLCIAGCTLATTVAAGLSERKRAFSLLRLAGAPLSALRRVVILETAVPLLIVAVVSLGAGFAGSALFLHAQLGHSLVVPQASYFVSLVGGLGLSLTIISATFPLLNRITGPETARNE